MTSLRTDVEVEPVASSSSSSHITLTWQVMTTSVGSDNNKCAAKIDKHNETPSNDIRCILGELVAYDKHASERQSGKRPLSGDMQACSKVKRPCVDNHKAVDRNDDSKQLHRKRRCARKTSYVDDFPDAVLAQMNITSDMLDDERAKEVLLSEEVIDDRPPYEGSDDEEYCEPSLRWMSLDEIQASLVTFPSPPLSAPALPGRVQLWKTSLPHIPIRLEKDEVTNILQRLTLLGAEEESSYESSDSQEHLEHLVALSTQISHTYNARFARRRGASIDAPIVIASDNGMDTLSNWSPSTPPPDEESIFWETRKAFMRKSEMDMKEEIRVKQEELRQLQLEKAIVIDDSDSEEEQEKDKSEYVHSPSEPAVLTPSSITTQKGEELDRDRLTSIDHADVQYLGTSSGSRSQILPLLHDFSAAQAQRMSSWSPATTSSSDSVTYEIPPTALDLPSPVTPFACKHTSSKPPLVKPFVGFVKGRDKFK